MTPRRLLFVHADIRELVDLQDARGQAKPYQVRQVVRLIERYALRLKDEE